MIVGDRDARRIDDETRPSTRRIHLQTELWIHKGTLRFDLHYRLTDVLQAGYGAALENRFDLGFGIR